MVEGDPDRLRLALRNLHENACGQSPPRGLVRWGLAGQGGIAVEDEGPGIPPDEIPLVTQRFYRGRGTKVAGSGLGLAIVEAALAGSGGALAFAKPTSGQGLRAEIAFREARSIPEQGPA
ncbi:histidine kinase OS=Bosea thiooxidans OX=53254 GN=ARD30_19585 PE=4 SV=1 [Bosea thiooxidans]